MFLCMFHILGVDTRHAHELFFRLGCIILFSLLLDNIWITAFLCWTVFLFTYFKFQYGGAYISNIFGGCLLYYLTKISFKKKHIDALMNGIFWLVFLNLLFVILQVLRLDYMHKLALNTVRGFEGYMENFEPVGLLGFKGCMGILMAITIPLLACKQSKWANLASIGLLVPLYLSKASSCVVAGIVGLLFVIWHRLPYRIGKIHKNWVFLVLFIVIIGLGVCYIVFVDYPMGTLPERVHMWKLVMRDTIIHPITGWGLDSFRTLTQDKSFMYAQGGSPLPSGGIHLNYWDNPHNLPISVMFEFGMIGIFIMIGYYRQLVLWFMQAVKQPNTIGLAGFVIALTIVNVGHFPLFLARMCVVIIPIMALYEVQMRTK